VSTPWLTRCFRPLFYCFPRASLLLHDDAGHVTWAGGTTHGDHPCGCRESATATWTAIGSGSAAPASGSAAPASASATATTQSATVTASDGVEEASETDAGRAARASAHGGASGGHSTAPDRHHRRHGTGRHAAVRSSRRRRRRPGHSSRHGSHRGSHCRPTRGCCCCSSRPRARRRGWAKLLFSSRRVWGVGRECAWASENHCLSRTAARRWQRVHKADGNHIAVELGLGGCGRQAQ
jgi:hypothetical protein